MSVILGVETSAEGCSVALSNDTGLYHAHVSVPRQHTQKLLPMIDDVLRQANCQLSDVDALAYSRGPGSFTGLRIGLGVAQGLAYGADLPLIPISTLELIAQSAMNDVSATAKTYVLVAIDARMSEVYWCLYENQQGTLIALVEEQVSSPITIWQSSVVKNIDLGSCVFVGSGWHYEDLNQEIDMSTWLDLTPKAETMMSLAQRQWQTGDVVTPEQALPVYLRDSVAWQKRKKIRTQ
jgi:tRNA threonylcarbamoyladenosine biosynthesis protein TsaB